MEPRYSTFHSDIVRDTKDGPITLTNFVAKIAREFHVSDGADGWIEFEIEATLDEARHVFILRADEFAKMAWPIEHLGAKAIVRAGSNVRDEVREAIQQLSNPPRSNSPPPIVRVFRHLGWVNLGREWGYVHAGGIIRPDCKAIILSASNRASDNSPARNSLGVLPPKTPIPAADLSHTDADVRIDAALQGYCLPSPRVGNFLISSIHCSLDFIDLGPDHITLPLFAAIWRAAIMEANFSLFIYGETGRFKSELVLLASQFWGPKLTTANLAGWNSTANALAYLAFLAKETLFAVDDFLPSGTPGGNDKANRQADALLRSQGNRAARHRATSTGGLREGKPPRGLLVGTGETLPAGHSLNTRLLAIEIEDGDILDVRNPAKMRRINDIQEWARQGQFAGVMASFLKYLAADYEEHCRSVREQKLSLREVFLEYGRSPRLADIAADLLAGLEVFLEFAQDMGAIDDDRFCTIWGRFHDAIDTLLKKQDQVIFSEDPVSRYLELLVSALHTGRVHLKLLLPTSEVQDVIGSPALWGYVQRTVNDVSEPDDSEETVDDQLEAKTFWVPRGQQVGWKGYDDLYLDPEASLAAVNRYARDLGVPIVPIPKKTLGKRLRERNLLMNHDHDRNTLKRNIDGRRCEVFHISVQAFVDLVNPREDNYAQTIEREIIESKASYEARQLAIGRLNAVRAVRKAKRHERELLRLLRR